MQLYLGSILFFTLALAAGVLGQTLSHGIRGPLPWIAGALTFLAVSQLAIALVNLFATRLVTPHPLPRMDFSRGIPRESSTLVVVPTMLTSPENIGHLADALEVRFLANREDNLRFGLLTDFRDAPEEKMAGDEALLFAARQGIEELNEKYRSSAGDVFFLFHRPRLWNRQERNLEWAMKENGENLAELNALLRGGAGSGFSLIAAKPEDLSESGT